MVVSGTGSRRTLSSNGPDVAYLLLTKRSGICRLYLAARLSLLLLFATTLEAC